MLGTEPYRLGNSPPPTDRESFLRAFFQNMGELIQTSLGLLQEPSRSRLVHDAVQQSRRLHSDGQFLYGQVKRYMEVPQTANPNRLLRTICTWLGCVLDWACTHLPSGRNPQIDDLYVQLKELRTEFGARFDNVDAPLRTLSRQLDQLRTESDLTLELGALIWLERDFPQVWRQTMTEHPAENDACHCPSLEFVSSVWHDRQSSFMWEAIRSELSLTPGMKGTDLPCALLVRCQYTLSSGRSADFLVVGEASTTIQPNDIRRIKVWRSRLKSALERNGDPIALPVVPVLFSNCPHPPEPSGDILFIYRKGKYRFRTDWEFRGKMRTLLGWEPTSFAS